MKFAQIDRAGANLIDAYDRTSILIQGRAYRSGLAVSAESVLPDWGPRQFDDLDQGHLRALLASRPQVVVIGTGSRQRFPDPAVYIDLLESGIGVEIMDTGAACRTYNILVTEGRRVVAGLMLD